LKDRTRPDETAVVRPAGQELARGWKDDPDTLAILQDRARHDEEAYVRCTAVQELVRGWKDDPDTLSILKDCARSDENSDVRIVALRELARGWKDPDTLAGSTLMPVLPGPHQPGSEEKAVPVVNEIFPTGSHAVTDNQGQKPE